MAVNPPPGPGRVGAVKKRDQVFNPVNRRWTKRGFDKRFMDQKADLRPFTGVTKKNAKSR